MSEFQEDHYQSLLGMAPYTGITYTRVEGLSENEKGLMDMSKRVVIVGGGEREYEGTKW